VLGRVLYPLIAVLTWPVVRLSDLGRVYDLSIPPSDTCPLIRGAVAIDPLFRDFSVANAQSLRMEVVGRVKGNRFEIYLSGKYSTTIGLKGTIDETPTGSRVTANVGWCSPTKWVIPGITVLMLFGGFGLFWEVPRVVSKGEDPWPITALGLMAVGGQLLNLSTVCRRARNDDLPKILEHVDRVLGPYQR